MEKSKDKSSYWEFYLGYYTENCHVYIDVYHEERYVDTIFGNDMDDAITNLEKFMHNTIVNTFIAMRHYDMKNFVSKIKAY